MNGFTDHWWGLASALALLALAAWIADWLTTRIFRGTVRRIAQRTRSTWDDRIIERKVFARIAHTVPAAIIYYGISPALGVTPAEAAQATDFSAILIAWTLVRRVAASFIVITLAVAFSSFLNAVNDIYNETYPFAKSRPIKGYLQVVSLLAYITAVVVVVSILAEKSPVVFLSGLGALTAVLMLVFRDTILSLVASIQIMSNDMIRIGDWIEMPQANADGDVIDIALHTVKVQNWDKTITTIPTHRFIGDSFKNWRGMTESGARRIKRAIRIDMTSVHFLSDEEVERLSRLELLRDYMRRKRAEIEEYNRRKAEGLEPDVVPEVRRLTNLGTFRAYLTEYLRTHPQTHKEMTLLVRQLPPGPDGIPIEIYCFSNDTDWGRYEAFQADIFDHVIAVLPEFGLRPFQEPTGADWREAGGLHPSGAPSAP